MLGFFVVCWDDEVEVCESLRFMVYWNVIDVVFCLGVVVGDLL